MHACNKLPASVGGTRIPDYNIFADIVSTVNGGDL
jgi:hypothetical protein